MGTKGWRFWVCGVCVLNYQNFKVKMLFFSFSMFYTFTPPSKAQTESSNSTGIFRQYNLCHQGRIQSEDTTVLCCFFRNFSQFINTKHSPFSACSFSKFRYFPYLAQKVKNQNCLKVKYLIPKKQELIFNRPVKIKLS